MREVGCPEGGLGGWRMGEVGDGGVGMGRWKWGGGNGDVAVWESVHVCMCVVCAGSYFLGRVCWVVCRVCVYRDDIAHTVFATLKVLKSTSSVPGSLLHSLTDHSVASCSLSFYSLSAEHS